jgi:hypothetical protein
MNYNSLLCWFTMPLRGAGSHTISLLFLHTAVDSRFQLVKLRVVTDSLLVRGGVVSVGLFELRLHVLERLSQFISGNFLDLSKAVETRSAILVPGLRDHGTDLEEHSPADLQNRTCKTKLQHEISTNRDKFSFSRWLGYHRLLTLQKLPVPAAKGTAD